MSRKGRLATVQSPWRGHETCRRVVERKGAQWGEAQTEAHAVDPLAHWSIDQPGREPRGEEKVGLSVPEQSASADGGSGAGGRGAGGCGSEALLAPSYHIAGSCVLAKKVTPHRALANIVLMASYWIDACILELGHPPAGGGTRGYALW
eukprot:6698611-Lingulodinium_polyedra.AAC.1